MNAPDLFRSMLDRFPTRQRRRAAARRPGKTLDRRRSGMMPEPLERRAVLSATMVAPAGDTLAAGAEPAVAVATVVAPVTYTITWAWNENLVLTDFRPAVDVLSLDWFSGTDLTLVEDAGSAVLSIPSMQQSYRFLGVPLASLTSANFSCKDPSAAALIAGVLADAIPPASPSPTATPTPTPTPTVIPSGKPNRNVQAGDTNVDWSVDILDVANILAGGKFQTGQSGQWGDGDFGGDGLVDVLDAAEFLATGLYDKGPYFDPDAVADRTIATTDKVLAAYFPEWGIYGRNFQIADVPGDQLNHLIYAFLNLKSDGQVAIYDSFAAVEKRFSASESVTGEADLWYYPPSDPRSTQTVWGNFNQIALLKQKYPHMRVSIAVGGWTLSGHFSSVCSTAAGRETFATSLTNFLDTYRMFDGIDFDWEYPGGGGLDGNSSSPSDGANYAALLQLVRTKFDALGQQLGRRYGISVASPAGGDKIANFNLPGLAPFVDHFNLMAYDFHGTWENTTGHQAAFTGDATGYDVKTAVQSYLAAGVAPEKIVLGAPLYTRGWSGVADGGDGGYLEATSGKAPGTFEAGVYDYKDLLTQLQSATGGWQLYWDDTAQAAYVYNASRQLFSSFETPTSIAQKSQWADEIGLGGMMFWDISNDALDSAESLVAAGFSSWVLGDDITTIRSRSSLTGELIVGGDGVISALPPIS